MSMLSNKSIKSLLGYITWIIILSLAPSTAYADRNQELFYDPDEINQSLSIFMAGDLMVHGAQLKSAFNPSQNTYNFKPWFEFILPPIANADFALLNLETTITENPNAYSGFPLFKSPHHLIYDLKTVGFDGLVTANNHSLDGGLTGVETTIKHIQNANLLYTGTALKDTLTQPMVMEANGLRIALINATYGTNGIPMPKNHPTAVRLLESTSLIDQVSMAKALSPDAIIAFVHWGTEYAPKPNAYQKQWAQWLANQGVDAIIGAHPHVIQEATWIHTEDNREVYVNYSLGNFVSNQRWRYSDTGLAVTLNFTKKTDQERPSLQVAYLPFWVDKEDAKGNIGYQVIPLDFKMSLDRISNSDFIKIQEATADFYNMYPDLKK